ncbi:MULTISPECIES: hypothetical protein [unclassified Avibacterium]|uniref:hypothetical protein n=1 Tax=unclassified Avibacterium TaxID=2685287 RepID=UPI002025BC6E|nr:MULTISPECIES: hypothetical protein [unclassified Avibacterium]MCW9698774.1 hypothetical protein [Avibacterium sp. 20-129]URL07003.1 hypothetical protein L4F92_02490 [Avibacterium sp. 21-595]
MITKRITLPDGTLIEFFANNTEEMALMLPEYAETLAQKRAARLQQLKETQRNQQKARRKRLQRQKLARRKARGQ